MPKWFYNTYILLTHRVLFSVLVCCLFSLFAGQVQYVLATPSQMNQVQVLQAPLLSPTQQNPGQMVS